MRNVLLREDKISGARTADGMQEAVSRMRRGADSCRKAVSPRPGWWRGWRIGTACGFGAGDWGRGRLWALGGWG